MCLLVMLSVVVMLSLSKQGYRGSMHIDMKYIIFVDIYFMKSYCVYILKCVDGSYYTGVTSDLDNRIVQHQEGKWETCYTFRRRPVELMYYESYQWVFNAIAREKQIKGWSRVKKEALINGEPEKLVNISKSKVNK
ncbi:MAG: GIY-YIG nuclease family protein [Sphingomonadales bacterium]